MQLTCGNRILDLSQPVVMGILNVTPDSFSDGGSYYHNNRLSRDLALKKASQMLADGAGIIDIGGESTRPGAQKVSVTEELERVVPLVEAIAGELGALVSVDTSSPEVMTAAAAAGAAMINDVRALQREGALAAAADTGLPVCLMHMQGAPDTMQVNPRYRDVVAEVTDFLRERVAACAAAGIGKANIVLDPGYGFGKTLAHNLALVRELERLVALGFPVLVGLSRKSLIGKLLGREVDERLPASLALALMAAQRGASIIRVHDVAETCDVLKMHQAVLHFGE